MKQKIAAAGILLTALLVFGAPLYAQDNPGATTPQKTEREKSQKTGQSPQTTAEPATNPTQTTQLSPAKAEDKRSTFSEAQRKTCRERKAAIARIFTNVGNKGETALQRLMNIQVRLESFYTSKHLDVADYAALAAAASAAQNKAKTTLGAVKGVSFSCDSANPEAAGRTFQANSKAFTGALQEYRNALKKLITAIRTAAKNKEI